jgi:hypothetical protein
VAQRAVVKPRKQCKIGDLITIDACLEESHQLDSEVTDHEVEEGFSVSDHARPKPAVVTLRCFVSNTPLSLAQMRQAVRETASSESPSEISAVAGRGNDVYKKLKRLRDTGELVQLVTTLTTYTVSDKEGMIVQSVTIPRTSRNFDGLEFSVTFKQIRIVKNKQTRDVTASDRRVGKKKKTGAQTGQEKAAPEKTLAAGGADYLAGSSNQAISGFGAAIGGVR